MSSEPFPSVELYSTLLLLALQQPHSPPSEEVGRVAVVLLAARLGCCVLVSYQRGLLEEVAQGVMVTLRADIAYI
jgi:hypothetical protein